jgi:hypothetical protein
MRPNSSATPRAVRATVSWYLVWLDRGATEGRHSTLGLPVGQGIVCSVSQSPAQILHPNSSPHQLNARAQNEAHGALVGIIEVSKELRNGERLVGL